MQRVKNFSLCIIGSFLYCIGTNIFIIPANLYSGGFVGIAQLIVPYIPFDFGFSWYGIVYLLLNIPLYIVGIFKLGKRFVAKSLFLILIETVFLTILPIPDGILIDNFLTNCIIGGCIQGLGIGVTFRGFASGGGTDILGLILTKDIKFMSVGKTSIIVNAILYGICAYKFDINIAIYSIIASLFCSIIIDKIHIQNKVVSVNILSEKYDKISDVIIKELNRSATILEGIGAYSNSSKKMIVSIMSEYELKKLKAAVKKEDPNAFIFIHPNITVIGDFEKRLNKS